MDTDAADKGPILELDDVIAGYGANAVLDRINFVVRRGAITTITGPNGAGKSTIFKTVFGLLPAWQGKIRFDGEDIANAAPHRLLASGMGYIPQGRGVFPGLSVRHNIELGGTAARSRANLDGRVAAALERYPALQAKAEHLASTLTSGEQKLLEIARALMVEPKLLMIDEPSIGLTPGMAQEVYSALAALRARGVAVLIVEQNAKSLLGLSDDAIVVELGRTRHSDRAAALLADPRIGQLFLGGAMGATPPPPSGMAWMQK